MNVMPPPPRAGGASLRRHDRRVKRRGVAARLAGVEAVRAPHHAAGTLAAEPSLAGQSHGTLTLSPAA